MADRDIVKRFSDEELHNFYNEFKKHQEHEGDDREKLLLCLNENKKAIQSLNTSFIRIEESTAGLVEAWNATQGAVKVSAVIGQGVKWLVGAGASIYAVYQFLKHTGKM